MPEIFMSTISLSELVDKAELSLAEDTALASQSVIHDWEHASPFRWSQAFNVLLIGGAAIALSLGGPFGIGTASALILAQFFITGFSGQGS